MSDPWADDKLGYKKLGVTFTNLIKTIDDSKVISIEAGFGRGKTFFRKAWAEHLRQEVEVVVEIDLRQSDHTGEPLVTLLGALASALPSQDKGKGEAAKKVAQQLGKIAVNVAARFAVRAAADELVESLNLENDETSEALEQAVTEFGDGMTAAAKKFVTAQMAAESIRAELPEQMQALREALLEAYESDRVIVLIDELDRCHPDYAISVLEALKLVFDQPGFVFCLMVNPNYLEKLAINRFGEIAPDDEQYIDKFVDIRLKLNSRPEDIEKAVVDLALNLPLAIPFGDSEAFSLQHAANLAGEFAVHCSFSMRKVKRVLLKVELALRCHSYRPLDASLLVYLACREELSDEDERKKTRKLLKRGLLTPIDGHDAIEGISDNLSPWDEEREFDRIAMTFGVELLELSDEVLRVPAQGNFIKGYKVLKSLASHYIPEHLEILNSVAAIISEQQNTYQI